MKPVVPKPQRCAIYTRKSTEHNLDLEFNSLDAQREACEAYIKSQAHEGWRLVPDRYDDGGLSGASAYRGEVHRGEHEPILTRDLFEAVQAKRAANAVARQVQLIPFPHHGDLRM